MQNSKEAQVMSEILFEVKKENLDTGLRGYPVGYCTTSTVDPIKGLFYADHPVHELYKSQPEEVIYLIFQGKVGSAQEVALFSQELQRRGPCKPELIDCIQRLPRQCSPIKLLSAALLLASGFEETMDYRENALSLIATIPEIAAVVINYHAGWGPTPPSDPKLGYMENFTHMLNVPMQDKQELLYAFKLFNILHYDHGGGNLSAFVGKAVASGLEDLYGSLAAAMCALAGPRHGKANQDSLAFVEHLIDILGENPSEIALENVLRKKLQNNELIFGFGHAVLRSEDPRASLLYDITAERYPTHAFVRMAHLLRKIGARVLAENPKISDPHANVDAISGVMLAAAGFFYPEYFALLFGMARVVGVARQIIYERQEAREGKGTPIVRPNYLFIPFVKNQVIT